MTRRRLALPRNIRNLTDVELGSTLVVSFVGSTDFRNPTVFADSGVQYDWGFTRDLHVSILVKPGSRCCPWRSCASNRAASAGS
jgi:hypothetical protein